MTSKDSGESSLSGRRGLVTWTQTRRDEMCSGTSLRLATGVCATRSSLQPTGMAQGKGRGDAKICRQARAQGRVEVSRNRTHVGQGTVLVRVQWSQRRPECLEKVAEPEELLREFLKRGDRAARGCGQQPEQIKQTAQLRGVQFHGTEFEIKGPPNPRHPGRQGGLAPTHGHPKHT